MEEEREQRIGRQISETLGNLISSDENRGGRKFQQLARELTFTAKYLEDTRRIQKTQRVIRTRI